MRELTPQEKADKTAWIGRTLRELGDLTEQGHPLEEIEDKLMDVGFTITDIIEGFDPFGADPIAKEKAA